MTSRSWTPCPILPRTQQVGTRTCILVELEQTHLVELEQTQRQKPTAAGEWIV
jgi:hypothetical protein